MRTVQISGTSLNTMQMCKRKAYYEAILGHTGLYKDESLQKGSLIHYMLQRYYEEKIKGSTFEQCVDRAHEAGQVYALQDEITLEPETVEFERQIFKKYTDYYRGELWVPLHVEVPFSKVLYARADTEDNEGLTILYEGKVDLIVNPGPNDNELLIVDHKTFSRSGPVSSLSNQFMGYAWAFQTKNVGVNRIGLHLKADDDKRFVRSLASYYQSRIDEWKYWAIYTTLEFLQNHDMGMYPPNFTSCDKFRGCIFREVCTSDPQIREWKLNTQYKKKDHDLYKDVEPEEDDKTHP